MPDTTYSADQIIGKTLIAATGINVRRTPEATAGNLIYTAKQGDTLGVVYSYVVNQQTGKLWWWIDYANPKWLDHAAGRFSLKALTDQGAKTTAQETQEKADAQKSWWQKFTEGTADFMGPLKEVTKYALPVGLVYLGYRMINSVGSNRKK